MKKRQKGFTLVELIVVIAIIAILASVAVVGYTQFINKSKESRAQAELDQVYNVLFAEGIVEEFVLEDNSSPALSLTVSVENGKLKLVADAALKVDEAIKKYAEGYEGTFALANGKLQYTLNGVTVDRDITYTAP